MSRYGSGIEKQAAANSQSLDSRPLQSSQAAIRFLADRFTSDPLFGYPLHQRSAS
jgi:hypothetical protein